jgi:SAM-dependent methyltransferase
MNAPNGVGLDFDEVYQGNKPVVPGAAAVPWDIGEPQPLLVGLEAAGEIRGEVLDAGCGLADNTLFLAASGYRVTGLDASSTAIERARAKARDRGLDAEFAVADVTRLDGFDDRFDTVVDSALYHCLTDEQQRAYATAVHRACRPGATIHLFCLSQDMGPIPGPRAISDDNLRETFSRGWRITRLEPAQYTTAFTRALVADRAQTVPANIPVDDQDRFLMPVWQLTAVRAP